MEVTYVTRLQKHTYAHTTSFHLKKKIFESFLKLESTNRNGVN